MNDVLLYIRNFAYSHDSANVSAADRANNNNNNNDRLTAFDPGQPG